MKLRSKLCSAFIWILLTLLLGWLKREHAQNYLGWLKREHAQSCLGGLKRVCPRFLHRLERTHPSLPRTSVWLPGLSPNVHTEARGHTPRPPYPKGVEGCVGLCWPGCEREERSAVHTIEGGGVLGYVGVGGEIQVKCRWWWFVALLIERGTPQVA